MHGDHTKCITTQEVHLSNMNALMAQIACLKKNSWLRSPRAVSTWMFIQNLLKDFHIKH